MVSGDSDWTAFSRHFMRKRGTFEGIAESNGVESKETQVAAYYSSINVPLTKKRGALTTYLVEA